MTIRHEIIPPPEKEEKPKDNNEEKRKDEIIKDLTKKLNDVQTDENQELLARRALDFFDSEKQRLICEHPEDAEIIRSLDSGLELDEWIEQNYPLKRAPSGKATLPQQSNSSLDEAETSGSLTNKIYSAYRQNKNEESKQEAKQKIDRLFDSLSHIDLEHMEKALRDQSFFVCANCGSVVKSLSPCPECGYFAGKQRKIPKRYQNETRTCNK